MAAIKNTTSVEMVRGDKGVALCKDTVKVKQTKTQIKRLLNLFAICQSYGDVCEQLQWIRDCLPALKQVAYGVWPACL